ncbi:MAG TPA: hypothetical protein VJT32_06135 [bacterium]|nr:hypothetical protein [bacterium]
MGRRACPRSVRLASVCAILLVLLVGVVAVPGFAAPGALRGSALSVSATPLSPLVALIAGILIPRRAPPFELHRGALSHPGRPDRPRRALI